MATNQTRKTRRAARRGYALILSLITALLLSVVGASLLTMAGTNLRLSHRRTESAQALQLALGGMDEGIAELRGNTTYTGFSNRSLGPGAVTVTITTPAGQPLQRVVESTGVVQGRGYTVSRKVKSTCSIGGIPPVFFHGIAAKRTISINGNVTVTSAPVLGQGDVHSNGDVQLAGSAVSILGKATASGAVSSDGQPVVSGGMTSGAPALVFPPVDPALELQALNYGSVTPSGGVLSVNSKSTVVSGRIAGDLLIGSSGATLDGVVWVTGNVTIGGPVFGKATLVSQGPLMISADGSYPLNSVINLLFITQSTSDTAVDLGGNGSFVGSIYAPNGGANLHGNPSLLGSLLADTITFSGNPTITRYTNFNQNAPAYPTMFQLAGWQE
jgi:hypothetical protein